MNIIDTHSHLYTEEFEQDIDEAIHRAKKNGIEKIFLPNINRDSISSMLSLCRIHANYLYPMIGLHPEDVTEDFRQDLQNMYALLKQKNHPFIGVGEIGLDYYWDQTYIKEQQEALEQQIEWAVEFGLPLMIHCRNAHHDLIKSLDKYRGENLQGVFHCFSGTAEEAEELLTFKGFALGIGGYVTFKKSQLPEVLPRVPLERIVLETDSPYLTPVPHRGKRNESAYLIHILDYVADIYSVRPETVAETTTRTALSIFTRSA